MYGYTWSILGQYSSVPNKRVGWNKCDGRKNITYLINVLDGINMMVGKF